MATNRRIDDLSGLRKALDRYTGDSNSADWEDAKLDAIQMCEADLNNRLRVKEMVVRAEAPIDDRLEVIPPNAEDIIYLAVIEESGQETPLISTGPERAQVPAGLPTRAYISGKIIELFPAAKPEDQLKIRIEYYGVVPDIWGDEPCNDLLLRYPNLYLYGALQHLYVYKERAPVEIAGAVQLYDAELVKANAALWKNDRRVHRQSFERIY